MDAMDNTGEMHGTVETEEVNGQVDERSSAFYADAVS